MTGWLSDLLKAAGVDPPDQVPTALPIVPSVTSNSTMSDEMVTKTAALARIASGELTLIEAMRLAQDALK